MNKYGQAHQTAPFSPERETFGMLSFLLSDLEVSLVQWQEKAGWDVPALYLDIREETPVRA